MPGVRSLADAAAGGPVDRLTGTLEKETGSNLRDVGPRQQWVAMPIAADATLHVDLAGALVSRGP